MTADEHDAAYVEFVTARMPWLRRFAFLLCRDWHRADDLVQTAVTKLYANWPRAERMENLDAYTRRILVNSYLAEQRSPWWKRVVVHGDGPVAEDGLPTAPHLGGEADLEGALDLRAALMRLTPRQRAVLVLRYFDDLSVAEAAAALGCSTGNVKKLTWVALGALRTSLAAETGPTPDTSAGADPHNGELRAGEGQQAMTGRTPESVRRQGAASLNLMGTGFGSGIEPAGPDRSFGR
jgi:RNA polymerase sigma-70 factor (sigma-E family)